MLKTCDSEHASILHDSPDSVRVNTILSVYLHATLISTNKRLLSWGSNKLLTCHLQSCGAQPRCRWRHCPNNKFRCGGGHAICWTARRFWLSSTTRMSARCFFGTDCILLVTITFHKSTSDSKCCVQKYLIVHIKIGGACCVHNFHAGCHGGCLSLLGGWGDWNTTTLLLGKRSPKGSSPITPEALWPREDYLGKYSWY